MFDLTEHAEYNAERHSEWERDTAVLSVPVKGLISLERPARSTLSSFLDVYLLKIEFIWHKI